jgi:hypothetical protein
LFVEISSFFFRLGPLSGSPRNEQGKSRRKAAAMQGDGRGKTGRGPLFKKIIAALHLLRPYASCRMKVFVAAADFNSEVRTKVRARRQAW